MARRRDSASERLKEWIEHAKKPRVPEQSLIELGRRLVPKGQQKTIDWNDRAQRAYCAHEALLLNLGELDEPLRKAFDAFGYDPINPFDWRMLLSHFAYAHFAPPRKRGAPKNGTTIGGASCCRISVKSKQHLVPPLRTARSARISRRDSRLSIRRNPQGRYAAICNMREIRAATTHLHWSETNS
jgi:hypothetical protein